MYHSHFTDGQTEGSQRPHSLSAARPQSLWAYSLSDPAPSRGGAEREAHGHLEGSADLSKEHLGRSKKTLKKPKAT